MWDINKEILNLQDETLIVNTSFDLKKLFGLKTEFCIFN